MQITITDHAGSAKSEALCQPSLDCQSQCINTLVQSDAHQQETAMIYEEESVRWRNALPDT